MAHEPPVSFFRSPDQSLPERPEQTNKTHQAASPNSSYNSTNSQNTDHIAICEMELDGIQKIISSDRDKLIHRRLFSGNDPTNQGLQHTQKSHDSVAPIARYGEAISGNFDANSPELRLQIRPTSHQFHDDLTTGNCSPGEEVHPTAISGKMASQITGNMNSGEQAVEGDNGATRGECSLDEVVHLTNISINLTQKHSQNEIPTSFINSTINPQNELEELKCKIEEQQQETFSQDQAGPNGQKHVHNAIEKQQIEMESPQVDK
uniref:Uncharacterized protein n=1 Tax=Solanum tuberosum TaxID=4113 RepID=M1DR39_SOLTU